MDVLDGGFGEPQEETDPQYYEDPSIPRHYAPKLHVYLNSGYFTLKLII